MKQMLAIMAKDARRFWPEILVCFVLLIALVRLYPSTWRSPNEAGMVMRGGFFVGQNGMGLLASCLVVLIPIAWLVLIAGAVHCERLVGDTQFWLTRPYDWRRLLGAKLLYLITFLYAPFFLAQCVLLREGGFHPFHYAGGLLFNLLLLTAVGVMPVLALSSITTGFGRLTLVLLGLIIAIVVVSAISSNLPSDVINSVPDLLSGSLAMAAILCGSLAVVIVMYAQRRTKAGWLMVGTLTAVMCATAFFDPDRGFVEKYYPALSAGSAPVTLVYGARNLNQPVATETADRRAVDFAIPMTASGVREGSAVVPIAFKVAMVDASGIRWRSPWQGYGQARFLPGESATTIRFRMRRDAYDQLKSATVTLRVSIALAEAHKAGESRIPLPVHDFAVPEIGVCTPQYWNLKHDEISGIACRSAMNQPQLTYVTALWSQCGCAAAADGSSKQELSTGWIGELDPGPAEFGITSVWETQVQLSMPWLSKYWGTAPQSWSLCPGAPMSFTQYRPALRTREDVTIPGFRVPEISLGDQLKLLFGQ